MFNFFSHRPSILVSVVLLVLLLATPFLLSANESISKNYTLKSQSLGDALNAISKQSGRQFMVDSQLINGKTAPAIQNVRSLDQALTQLLGGTGLKAIVSGDRVIITQNTSKATSELPIAEGKNSAGTQSDSTMWMEGISVVAERENRISTGATGLRLEIKDTPQSISTIDQKNMIDHGVSSSNRALELMAGVDVQQYETNRATYNLRGFEIQLTQIDGKGTTNDYATVTGEHDTFIYEKIELIRGANGLLTGVGNSSGTINYIRKRPTNEDEGSVNLSVGSYEKRRVALDYNKTFTDDGSWAGRVVVAREEKESHIRDLKNERTTVYGVVDGQIGNDGVLTIGMTYQKNDQQSPMWGSLTLNYANGGYADFPVSSSTSVDWTYWNTETKNAFVEYVHDLGNSWVVNFTYNWNQFDGESKLLYAYTNAGGLNDDNTGLYGWPYAGYTEKESNVLDINISGEFKAFGNIHNLLAGINHSKEENTTYNRELISGGYLALPAFPYSGDDYSEPEFGPKTKRGTGDKKLTRLYVASRLQLTDLVHSIVGVNAIKLERTGSSIYGTVTEVTEYSDLEKMSPYFGLTYDITPDLLAYASYSDIYQNQDETDFDGKYLDPMKGVNHEVGLKSEFLNKKLLTTFAFFTAEQKGVATFKGYNSQGNSYNVPKDVNSKGFEIEASGQVVENSIVTLGLTHLELTGPDGEDTSEWIPRTTVNLRFDTRLSQAPSLKLGMNASWKSDAYKEGGAKQDAYLLANAFGSYEINKQASLRLNVNNLFDKKYVQGIAYGGIYGAPRNASLTLDYEF